MRYVPVAQPQQAYEYIDDAYEVNDAFGDSPPDYGFDYDGQRPWMWAAANAARVVEPYDGGERYYYYRDNSDDPYLVRDSSYSYAYSQGRLVSVYDNRGYVLDRIEAERRADSASRYYARARALRAAAARNHREQVVAANWAQRQARIRRDHDNWVREQQQIGQWRAYHARYSDEKARRYAAEKQRRQREAIAFQNWRDNRYAGPPPRVLARQEQKRNWQIWKRQQKLAQNHPEHTPNRPQIAPKPTQNHPQMTPDRRDESRRRAIMQARHDQQVRAQAQADARHDTQIRAQQRQKAVAVAQQKQRDQIQAQKAQAHARAVQQAKAKAQTQARLEARQIQRQKAKAVAATQQKQRAAQARIEARQKAIRDRHNDNREAPNIARN